MNILMLLQKDFPPDIRVEKEAGALIQAGHTIFLLCKNSKGEPDEKIMGIHVKRIKPVIKSRILRALINFPLFLNPFWIWQARSIVKNENIDIIHAHDQPMAPLAILAAGKRQKTIYDMHENYPAALRAWARRDLVSQLFKNPRMAEWLDAFLARKVDQILVVVDEFKDELITRAIPEKKIAIIGNRVEGAAFLQIPKEQNILTKYRNDFILLYAGSFARDRGLEIPVQAMNALHEKIPNIKLLLVGEGPNRQELADLARKSDAENLVEFCGWQPFQRIPSFMEAANVCLIPQPANAFINTTIPHKLFQYMVLRRPVVVSDAKPLARFVHQFNAGEIFASNDVSSFQEAILKIYTHKREYYHNSDDWLRQIDWQLDAKQLISTYNQLDSPKSHQ